MTKDTNDTNDTKTFYGFDGAGNKFVYTVIKNQNEYFEI